MTPSSSTAQLLRRATILALMALLLLASACRSGGSANEGASSWMAQTGGVVTAPVAAATDEDEDADKSEEKDYWAAVRFDRLRFKEVMEFVRLHYIDAQVNQSFAYERAANFALFALEEDLELLPESFLKTWKDKPLEKNRLAGTTSQIKGVAGVVLLKHVKDWQKDDRRKMSDEEILAERRRLKARYKALRKAWERVKFGVTEFDRVMRLAEERARKKGMRSDEVWIAAAQGYLASLDPHSSLVSAEEWKASTEEIRDASFEGIGALLTKRQDDIIVESPIEGQPAAAAGLRAGDVIVKVDNVDVRGKLLSKVVKMIRGKKGTKVVLTVRRVGVPEDLAVPIIRSYIAIKNVSSHLMGPEHPEIGYVKVRGYIQGVTANLAKHIHQLQAKSESGRLRGLILDLRNNSGGLLQEAVRMSDLFLRSGKIVIVKSRVAADEVYSAEDDRDDVDLPLVVLVDDGTASAAEIVANALQENRRALIVGDRTFGKATVQSLQQPVLGSGYFVKLTIARYYGPLGNTLQVHGVHPDVEVPPDMGGKMPVGFREEDIYDHLAEIPAKGKSTNQDLVEMIRPCVTRTGIAKKIHDANPNPVIKFDNQLYTGADWLECLANRVAAKKAKAGEPN